MIISTFFHLILLFINLTFADTPSAQSEWYNLLHYEKGLLGIKSNVDDPLFFITKNGRQNPEEEFTENVAKVTQKEMTFICKFPARFKYINKILNLNIDLNILKSCDKYQLYFQDHYPRSVFMVFSSYYLESPASAFGHTFLRFSKNDSLLSDKTSELLDTGINYGASNTSTNPFIYTIYGLAGGFKGTFSSIPYFYKIREYNDFESRDLWSYELNLSEPQKEKLLDHLWELGGTWYYYYFFTGNCSQKILSLLDGVDPSWKFLEKLPFYVIPSETIKVVNQEKDLVRAITFRPSKRRLFQNAYADLLPHEKKIFKQFIEKDDWSFIQNSNLPTQSKAKILDVAIEFADYKYSQDILLEKGEHYEWKKKILLERSQFTDDGINLSIAMPQDEKPHLSHSPQKTSFYVVNTKDQKDYTFQISHRFALHDFTDATPGNPKLSSINFFKTDLDISKHKISLHSFTPVEVTTFNPWGSYFTPVSIYGKIDYSKNLTELCSDCRIFNGTMASGPSWSFYDDHFVPFIFINTDFMFSNGFEKKHYDLNAGLVTGFILRIDESFSSFIKYKKAYALLNKKENSIAEITAQFHHSRRFDSSFKLNLSDKKRQLMLGFNLFY
jgi:hypothetical protein